jgi:predicted membrane protein
MVAIIVISIIWANLAVCMPGSTNQTEQKSTAGIEASTTISYTIHGFPRALAAYNGQWSAVMSTREQFIFNVTLPASSPFSLDDLNITWELQTDWNTTAYVKGPSLIWVYNNEADNPPRSINVTVTEKADSSNTKNDQISVQVVTDMDTDGLPDWWERKYFGTTGATDGTGDLDHDGWTDLEEYQNGTDPTKPDPKPGFLETYSWLISLIAIIIVVIVLLIFVVMPKKKVQREESEKKKIAAAVEVEKSLLGLDELEEKK